MEERKEETVKKRWIGIVLALFCACVLIPHMNVPAQMADAEALEQDPQTYRATHPFDLGEETASKSGLKGAGSLVRSPFNDRSYSLASTNYSNGIDVSYHNGTIDWMKAKNAGVKFAFIRVGYRGSSNGGLYQDVQFQRNMQNATAAGVRVGVYIYSQATTVSEARQEANYVLNRIGPYNVSMPIIMDYEYAQEEGSGAHIGRLYQAHLSRSEATRVCNAFFDTVQAAGYDAGLYASKSVIEDQMIRSQLNEDALIWLARYNTYLGTSADCWQYSPTGQVNGINDSKVDCNFLYRALPDGQDKLSVSGTKYPAKLKVGEGYTVKGTVQSAGSALVSVTAGIYDENGDAVYQKTVKPGVRSYNLKGLAAQLKFSSLPSGTYTYRVKAKNASGSKTLVKRSFTVGNPQPQWTLEHSQLNLLCKPLETQQLAVIGGSQGLTLTYRTDDAAVVTVNKTGLVTPVAAGTATISVNDGTRTETCTVNVRETIPAAVKLTAATAMTSTKVELKWTKQTEGKGYLLYRSGDGGKTWDQITRIANADTTSYLDTGLVAGKTYRYTVQVMDGAFLSDVSNIRKVRTLKKPTIKVYSSATGMVQLSWNSISAATGYKVYRDGKVIRVVDSSVQSLTDKGLVAGKSYSYMVRAIGETGVSSRSDAKSARVLAVPTLKSVKSSAKKKVTVSWFGVSGANGYRIYRATSKNGTYKQLMTVSMSRQSQTLTGQASNKTYYYRVCAVNGSNISSASNAKKVKVK